ncbi:hypothetical protein ACCS78_39965, partial [Rhizobium johnstonii]
GRASRWLTALQFEPGRTQEAGRKTFARAEPSGRKRDRTMTSREHFPIPAVTRREVLLGTAATTLAALPIQAFAATASSNPINANIETGSEIMSSIMTKDGAQIFYKDWGSGQPIVFEEAVAANA